MSLFHLLTKYTFWFKINIGREAKEMYEGKRYLTANEIYKKDFKMDARGYRPQEVDNFLDMVIKDYEDFESTTDKLLSELKSLELENSKLKAEIRNLQASLDIAGSNKGVTNVDLLKRNGYINVVTIRDLIGGL